MKAPTIQRAVPQLVDLAVRVRPDWREADLRAVIAGAATIGMTWEQTLVGLARLMVDEHAHPRELIPDSRDPLRRPRQADPESTHRGAALARAALRKDHANG